MNHEQILAKLKQMLQARFDIAPETVDGSTRRSDMGIDSILMIDLILDIETDLDISFENLDLPPNPSLDDVAALIARNLPAG